jgi:hypothetical protein
MVAASRATGAETRRRKGHQAEARAVALKRLMPAAVMSLAAHVGDGDPATWRVLRMFEQAFGRPVDVAEEEADRALIDPFGVAENDAVAADAVSPSGA